MNSGQRPKCIGLAGLLFGHRFCVTVGDLDYKTDYCGRCGMRVDAKRPTSDGPS